MRVNPGIGVKKRYADDFNFGLPYPVLAKITQNLGNSPGKGVLLPHFAFTGGFPALTTSANVVQITASAGNAF